MTLRLSYVAPFHLLPTKKFETPALSEESETCMKYVRKKNRLADRGSVVSLSRIEKGGNEA